MCTIRDGNTCLCALDQSYVFVHHLIHQWLILRQTLFMFIARIIFFRLHESPRYLVHAGRPQEALQSLQLISRFNGSELPIELSDVQDHHYPHIEDTDPGGPAAGADSPGSGARTRVDSRTIFDANIIEDRLDSPAELDSRNANGENLRRGSTRPTLVTAYSSMGATPVLDSHAFDGPGATTFPQTITSVRRSYDNELPVTPAKNSSTDPEFDDADVRQGAPRRRLSEVSTTSRISSVCERRIHRAVPRWIGKPLAAWWSRVSMVLAPEWLRTTVLVWAVWWAMAFGEFASHDHFVLYFDAHSWTYPAFTMFNVFLPKLLETRMGPGKAQTLEESLWDVAIFTLGGCPGPLVCTPLC